MCCPILRNCSRQKFLMRSPADTIVVTAQDPVDKGAIDKLGSDKVVLDFAQFYRQGPGNLPGDNANGRKWREADSRGC